MNEMPAKVPGPGKVAGWTLAAVLLLALGALVLLLLAVAVSNGVGADLDRRLLLAFRDPANLADPLGPAWLEVVVRDVTALGGLPVLALMTLFAGAWLWLVRRRQLAVFLVVAIAGGSLFNTLLKELVQRPRPDLFPHGTAAALSSFPSGHATMSAVFYLTVGGLLALSTPLLREKVFFLAWSVALVALVGVSRLYLGVHWPSDVLAGWIAGSCWALLALLLGRRYFLPQPPAAL